MLYAGDRPLVVDAARPHHGRWLVRFRDVDDRDGAEALRGALLTGEPLGPLPEGAYWAHELVGAEMRDTDGRSLGTIVAVEANPASDLLILDAGALVPVAFMVSAGDGVVVVDPPDGLLEQQ